MNSIAVTTDKPAAGHQHGKFLLVVIAVQRIKQLRNGVRPRVDPQGHGLSWTALQEAEGALISWEVIEKPPSSAPPVTD
jgi:DNA-directed RNA polymerase subunit K/omega